MSLSCLSSENGVNPCHRCLQHFSRIAKHTSRILSLGGLFDHHGVVDPFRGALDLPACLKSPSSTATSLMLKVVKAKDVTTSGQQRPHSAQEQYGLSLTTTNCHKHQPPLTTSFQFHYQRLPSRKGIVNQLFSTLLPNGSCEDQVPSVESIRGPWCFTYAFTTQHGWGGGRYIYIYIYI